jgi:hypothetical protein
MAASPCLRTHEYPRSFPVFLVPLLVCGSACLKYAGYVQYDVCLCTNIMCMHTCMDRFFHHNNAKVRGNISHTRMFACKRVDMLSNPTHIDSYIHKHRHMSQTWILRIQYSHNAHICMHVCIHALVHMHTFIKSSVCA